MTTQKHIAQVCIDQDHWVGYHPWFWIKNYSPRDFDYNAESNTLTLFHSAVIADFYKDHPNLTYTTLELS